MSAPYTGGHNCTCDPAQIEIVERVLGGTVISHACTSEQVSA